MGLSCLWGLLCIRMNIHSSTTRQKFFHSLGVDFVPMISLNVIANNFVGVQFLRYECKQCHNNMQFWICYTLKVSFLIWVFGFSHHRLCHFFWKMRVKRHGGNLGAEAWRVQLGRQYQVYIKQPCFVNITCLHNLPMFFGYILLFMECRWD